MLVPEYLYKTQEIPIAGPYLDVYGFRWSLPTRLIVLLDYYGRPIPDTDRHTDGLIFETGVTARDITLDSETKELIVRFTEGVKGTWKKIGKEEVVVFSR